MDLTLLMTQLRRSLGIVSIVLLAGHFLRENWLHFIRYSGTNSSNDCYFKRNVATRIGLAAKWATNPANGHQSSTKPPPISSPYQATRADVQDGFVAAIVPKVTTKAR